MDPSLIEQVAFLTVQLKPCLPALLGYAGAGIAGGFLQGVGEDVYDRVKQAWERLQGKRPQLDEAAEELAHNPEDADAEASFRYQLKKLLEENRDLAEELQVLFPIQQGGMSIVGDRNITVGGSVTRSTLNTGDSSQFASTEDDD